MKIVQRVMDNLRLAKSGFPSPKTHVSGLPVTEKERLLAGVVSGRCFAIAEVDGFHRNRWTIRIGLSGRVQSEWVDDLDRHGWTISGGMINDTFIRREAERQDLSFSACHTVHRLHPRPRSLSSPSKGPQRQAWARVRRNRRYAMLPSDAGLTRSYSGPYT